MSKPSASSEFTVRPYAPGDETRILDLFDKVFREDNPDMQRRSLDEWNHLFRDNPAGVQGIVAESDEGDIIASYASLPVFCSVLGEKRLCTQVVDTAVDQDWRRSLRRKSLFVIVGREFLGHYARPGYEPYDQYIWGMPNERAYGAGTRVLGYKPVLTPMPGLVRSFDGAWIDELLTRAGSVTVEDFDPASPEEAGALFAQHVDEVPLGTWRDAAYLRWRYHGWPRVSYRGLIARRDGRPVLAAYFRRGWADRTFTPIVDWIGPGADSEAVAAMLARVAQLTLESAEGAPADDRIETWVMPHTRYWTTLTELGLAPEPTNFNLCIVDSIPDHDFEWARSNWFLTMGDSDIF